MVLFLTCACTHPATGPQEKSFSTFNVQEITSPARENSGQPELTITKDGRVILSWLEKAGDKKYALRFAVREKEQWSEVRTVTEGENFLVNWADFPSVVAMADGRLAAHWLVKNSAKPHAYDVNMAFSSDGGKTWTKHITPHTDKTETEHGFVSFFDWSDGKTGVVWLDGRKYETEKKAQSGEAKNVMVQHGEHGEEKKTNEMALRFAAIDKEEKLSDEKELDARVCDCCQTSAAMTSDGPIVAYRDRSDKEVRDISAVRFVGGQWTTPQTISADGWQINGCPVNGPVVSANGKNVGVAWYTEAGNQPQVKVAFSKDAGATFERIVNVSEGKTAGRVDLLLLEDGSLLVVWLAGGAQSAQVKCRRVKPNGEMDLPVVVAESSIERKSGFPRIARIANEVVFAWTDINAPARVRVAIAKL
jgi:hypothetical protein